MEESGEFLGMYTSIGVKLVFEDKTDDNLSALYNSIVLMCYKHN